MSYSILSAIVSGLIITASFPKIEIAGLIWFAFVPMLLAIKNKSLGYSFRIGMLTGFVHYMSLLYWLVYAMDTYGHLPLWLSILLLALLCLYMSLTMGLFCFIIQLICVHPLFLIIAPCIWVSFEYLRSLTHFAFPWGLIGYSQYKAIELIQIADITGIYGVSCIIMFVNISIFIVLLYLTKQSWHKQIPSLSQSILILLFVFTALFWTYSYGIQRIQEIDQQLESSQGMKVSVIQGNIAQDLKWDDAYRIKTTKKYLDLTRKASADLPELVIWPETALTFYVQQKNGLSKAVKENSKNLKIPLITGGLRFEKHDNAYQFYNSAFLINTLGEIMSYYDKSHLVPYGEYIPFKKWFPFINKLTEGVGDFSAGKKIKPLEYGDHHLGIQICFEIIFPDLSRKMVLDNTDILITITNDAWYGRSSAPYQHYSMVVFRAVENKRSIARSANTGISGFIDPLGRMDATTELFKDAIETRKLPICEEITTYTRMGDFFASSCLMISLAISILGYFYQFSWLKRYQ